MIYQDFVWPTKKLRHYMLSEKFNVVAEENRMRDITSQPIIPGRISCWTVLLSDFILKFQEQKSIKEEVVSDFLDDHLIRQEEENHDFGKCTLTIDILFIKDRTGKCNSMVHLTLRISYLDLH